MFKPNPLDQLLKQAKREGHQRFLLCWNRGLGDIPLGLYALVYRIRTYLPEAKIIFATRVDLADGFKMLTCVSTLIDETWKRGEAFDLDATLAKAGLDRSHFDTILEHPDPTRWLRWQWGKLTPRLCWNSKWDHLAARFGLSAQKIYIGAHVQTQTRYGYEKNWPIEYWHAFFKQANERSMEIILFGNNAQDSFEGEKIHDFRGKTSLLEMLALIKNHCRYLVVPDSGVLSMTYYIDASFPIDIISIWADPQQGVLKQNVASPNAHLSHHPLIAVDGDLSTLTVDCVMNKLDLLRNQSSVDRSIIC